jgi:hypothetical protein
VQVIGAQLKALRCGWTTVDFVGQVRARHERCAFASEPARDRRPYGSFSDHRAALSCLAPCLRIVH